MMNEARWRSIISRKITGPIPLFWRFILRLASWPFSLAARVRLLLYRLGLLRQSRVKRAVICIGNLTVGGTGKTPAVALLAQRLRVLGYSPGILSRGYKAAAVSRTTDAQPINDEAMVLHALVPSVPHVQDPNRVRGAEKLVSQGCNVIVLDDGFSHLRLKRDSDILLFDATCPDGYGAMLPRGTLREPMNSARRANAAIITRCDAVNPQSLADTEAMLSRLGFGFSQKPLLHAEHTPSSLEQVAPSQSSTPEQPGFPPPSLDWLKGKPILAMCAIGNHEAFYHSLTSLGANIVERASLPDHFEYGKDWLRDDWPRLVEKAQATGAHAIVVTQKDAVKLAAKIGTPLLPVLELRVTMTIREGHQAIDSLLTSAIQVFESIQHKQSITREQ